MYPRHARPRARRGAALIELSLTLIPFMALMLAIVDYSLPIFLRSTFAHATREGTRYGITYRTVAGKTHSESIKDIVVQQSMGFLNGDSGRALITVRFYNPTTFVEELGANRNARGNVVTVAINGYQWGVIAPLLRAGGQITLGAASSDRLESPPTSTPLPAP